MRESQDLKTVIQRMVERLVAEYDPQKVILFGSYGYGSPDQDSDVDLLIVKDTSERFLDRWVTARRILTGIHRGIPVETLVVTPQEMESRLAAGDQFMAEILEKGQVLYAA